MASVWKRIQRVGKQAAKFEFFAQLQSVTLECKKEKKWTPTKLVVLWQRGAHRRKYSKPFNFQPGIAKPYRGVMVWVESEELDMVCTLYKDDKVGSRFEPKAWTFIILDESSGRRKPIAQGSIDMAQYYSVEPSCKPMTIKMKPSSNKVAKAEIDIALSCIFLREGKATDEDMLSVASMMSLNDLDSFEFEEEHRFPGNNSVQRASSIKKSCPSPQQSSPCSESGSSVYLSCDSGFVSNISNTSDVFVTPKKRPSSPTTLDGQKLGMTADDSEKYSTPKQEESKKSRPDNDLLEWCKKVTSGYEGVNVTNMTMSWRDGLAFCALLHHFHPELIDFSRLTSKNIKQNSKLAFDGFEYLGIPKILDPNDMVRKSPPDKLTVMTYLHQIKHHFEDSSQSAINTLMSQYKFITEDKNEDMFFKTKRNEAPVNHVSHSSRESTEIDSVTDEYEVSSMLEQLKLTEKRIEVEKIVQSLEVSEDLTPESCLRVDTFDSIDEDETLNSIIEDGANNSVDEDNLLVRGSKETFATPEVNLMVECSRTDHLKHKDNNTALNNVKHPIADSDFASTREESKPRRRLPLTSELQKNASCGYKRTLFSNKKETITLSPLTDEPLHSSVKEEERVSNDNNSPVEMETKPSVNLNGNGLLQSNGDTVQTILFSPEINKQDLIQERARKLIQDARIKQTHLSSHSESEDDINARARTFVEAQKRKDEILQQKLHNEEDRKQLLRSQANQLYEQAKLKGQSTVDQTTTPPDFRKNPFTLVKKKSLKSLPSKRFLSNDAKCESYANNAVTYAASRKVRFDTFEEDFHLKPKRDVGAEIAAELARMNVQDDCVDSRALSEQQDSSEESTDEDVDVPVDDYYYELENFNLRSADEYYNSEINELDKETKALDIVAQKLELELRKSMAAGDKEEEEDLLQEWFTLVNKKNEIIRRQNEIALLAQGDELERKCEIINRELRVLSSMNEKDKSDDVHTREENLLSQLVMLVNQRNKLVQIEDTQLQQSAHVEEHVQSVLSQHNKYKQDGSAVVSMVGWMKEIKSKFW